MIRPGKRMLKSPAGYVFMRVVGVDTQHADIAFSPDGDTIRVSAMTTDAILMQGVSDVVHALDETELTAAISNLAEWLGDWHWRHLPDSFIESIRKCHGLPPEEIAKTGA